MTPYHIQVGKYSYGKATGFRSEAFSENIILVKWMGASAVEIYFKYIYLNPKGTLRTSGYYFHGYIMILK